MSDLTLLRAYEPVVRYTHGELFFPSAVDEFVRHCSLWEVGRRTKPRLLVAAGELDLERLAEFAHIPAGHRQFLRFVQEPASPLE